MLEIIGIMMLCKANKKLALARGRKPGGYVALTIILWVGMEILGFIIGSLLDLRYGSFIFVYGFAGIGALISFLCAKFGPKGDYVDPAEADIPAAGTYNVPVNQASYVPYPDRQAGQYGMPAGTKLNEFGMPVDDQGNYSPVFNQYGAPALRLLLFRSSLSLHRVLLCLHLRHRRLSIRISADSAEPSSNPDADSVNRAAQNLKTGNGITGTVICRISFFSRAGIQTRSRG